MKPKVDAQQIFINTAAIFGIGLLWVNFNEKVFKTVRYLISAPFTWPKKEADSEQEQEQEHICEACWADKRWEFYF